MYGVDQTPIELPERKRGGIAVNAKAVHDKAEAIRRVQKLYSLSCRALRVELLSNQSTAHLVDYTGDDATKAFDARIGEDESDTDEPSPVPGFTNPRKGDSTGPPSLRW